MEAVVKNQILTFISQMKQNSESDVQEKELIASLITNGWRNVEFVIERQ